AFEGAQISGGQRAAPGAIERVRIDPQTLVITRRPPEGVQKQFIDFATSKRVIDLQLKYGFVPYEE
ncbi:MAG: ASKHA domain-containing protein, partial [Burkholderiales bacterium]